jgi:hypothetical protein
MLLATAQPNAETRRKEAPMSKRNVKLAAIVVAALLIAAVGYPYYFDWWDHKNCSESGGTWNEAQGECIEPRGADIPNTEKSLHSSGGDKPRE